MKNEQEQEQWVLEAAGAGRVSDFIGTPFFTKLMVRLDGKTTKTERTITGGWAIFSKIEEE